MNTPIRKVAGILRGDAVLWLFPFWFGSFVAFGNGPGIPFGRVLSRPCSPYLPIDTFFGNLIIIGSKTVEVGFD